MGSEMCIRDRDSTSTGSTSTLGPRKTTLGRRMGGWVLGRWGVAPVSADSESTNSPTTSVASSPSTSTSTPKSVDPLALRFRYPGVNQKGPVMGLRPPPPAPISIHAESIDEDLLRESLAEENP